MGNPLSGHWKKLLIAAIAVAALSGYLWTNQHKAAQPQAVTAPAADAAAPRSSARPIVAPAQAQRIARNPVLARFTYATGWATETRPEFLRFKQWTERYRAAKDPVTKQALVAEGVARAKERRLKMAALIRQDPHGAIDATVPADMLAELPAEVLAQLEERIAGRGDFEVIARTNIGAVSKGVPTLYREVEMNGVRYDAYVYGQRESETTKRDIPLHGVALDGALAVHESAVRALEPGETVNSAQLVSTAFSPAPGGIYPSQNFTIVQVSAEYAEVGNVAHLQTLNTRFAQLEAGINPKVESTNLVEAAAPSGQSASMVKPLSWTTGSKKVLIALFDFSDLPGNPIDGSTGKPITPQIAQDMVSKTVNSFYVDSSYSKTSLTATADSHLYRLPHPSTYYAQNDKGSDLLMADAKTLVSQHENPDSYDRFIIIFPYLGSVSGTTIDYGGLGYIGDNGVWLNGYCDFQTVAHELGHNYGLNHANEWQPASGGAFAGVDGQSIEYGDYTDVMGSGSDAHAQFNMYHKNELGWIPDAATTTISQSGTYRVYGFDVSNANLANTLALKISRSSTQTYWIGYRSQPPSVVTTTGAYIVFGYPNDLNQQSDQIKFDSESQNVLPVGESFTDNTGGITIKTVASGGTGATAYLDILVVYGGPQVLAPTQVTEVGFTASWTASTYAKDYSIEVSTNPDFLPNNIVFSQDVGNQTSVNVSNLKPGITYYYRVHASGDGFSLPVTKTNIITTTSVPYSAVVHVHSGDTLKLMAANVPDTMVLRWNLNNQQNYSSVGGTLQISNVSVQQSGLYEAYYDGGLGPIVAKVFVVVSSPASQVLTWSFNNHIYEGDTVSAGLHDLAQVAASGNNIAVLKGDGTVYEWGDNSSQQNNVPADLTNVVRISLGKDFSLAVLGDGTVRAWGRNDKGQCNIPAGLNNVLMVSAGISNAIAVKDDGTVVTWGNNATVSPSLTQISYAVAGDQAFDVLKNQQEVDEWQPNSTQVNRILPSYIMMTQLAGNDQELFIVLDSEGAIQIRNAPGTTTWNTPSDSGHLIKLAAGSTTNLGLTDQGELKAWGAYASLVQNSQLAFDVAVNDSAATAIVDDPNIPHFAAGGPTIPSVVSGGNITISSTASDATSYQWQLSSDGAKTWSNLTNNATYSGTTDANLTISNVSIEENGLQYRVVASGTDASITSTAATLNYYNSTGARLSNLSTRSAVGPDEKVQIAGFYVSGDKAKQVLIRASGPALKPQLGSGYLNDPVLTIFSGQNIIGTNDDWDASLQSAFAATGANAWTTGSKDAAIVMTLQPGAYTAQVSGKNGATGIALVEVFEYDTSPNTTKLVNVSTRSFVGVGAETQIAGFYINGTSPKHVLIRAAGPALAAYQINGYLADPVLTIYSGQTAIATNDNWDFINLPDIAAKAGAAPWNFASTDAALYLTLNPGGYTAQVTGKGGTGIALIEVFEVP